MAPVTPVGSPARPSWVSRSPQTHQEMEVSAHLAMTASSREVRDMTITGKRQFVEVGTPPWAVSPQALHLRGTSQAAGGGTTQSMGMDLALFRGMTPPASESVMTRQQLSLSGARHPPPWIARISRSRSPSPRPPPAKMSRESDQRAMVTRQTSHQPGALELNSLPVSRPLARQQKLPVTTRSATESALVSGAPCKRLVKRLPKKKHLLPVKTDDETTIPAASSSSRVLVRHNSVQDEMHARLCDARDSLLSHAIFLESRGMTLGVRNTASDDNELSTLLMPARAGTVLNYCRLFARFREYIAGDPDYCVGPLAVDPQLTKRWLEFLIAHSAGRYTPSAAMTALRYVSQILEFPFTGDSRVLRQLCRSYKESGTSDVYRAKGYTKRFLIWLECMASGLISNFSDVDRLVCGRVRLAAGASIRHDDSKRTPIANLSWVKTPLGATRGIVTRSGQTKTFPRHWACSAEAISVDALDWLQATLTLLWQAHGSSVESDDHLGKRASADRFEWTRSPPDGAADTCHVRTLMQEYSESLLIGDESAFSSEDVLDFRSHGAKATFTSLATHLGIDRTAVRHQGGWRGQKEDCMPDTYLRASQRLSLELQEQCIEHLQKGGDMMELITVPLLSEPPAFVRPNRAETRRRAAASSAPEDEVTMLSSDSSSTEPEDRPVDVEREMESSSDCQESSTAKWFLLNTESRKYHLMDISMYPIMTSSVCKRASKNAVSVDSKFLTEQVLDTFTEACGLCFPLSLGCPSDVDACQHICGAAVLDTSDICVRRCANIGGSTTCHEQGHLCSVCYPVPEHEPSVVLFDGLDESVLFD